MDDTADIQHKMASFRGQSFALKKNLGGLASNVYLSLFRAYCQPGYGVDIWDTSYMSKNVFKVFKIAYMKAVKSIFQLSPFFSNHALADSCNFLLLDHYIVKTQVNYFNQVFNNKNNFLRTCISYIKDGIIFGNLSKLLYSRYNCTLLDNDVRAVIARIAFVQRHETD